MRLLLCLLLPPLSALVPAPRPPQLRAAPQGLAAKFKGVNSAAAGGGGGGEKCGLLFDCDGVITDTEALHLVAYNAAYAAAGLTIGGERVHWSEEYYDVLQNSVGGGKNKMRFFFEKTARSYPTSALPSYGIATPPATEEARGELIDRLQAEKTELYKEMVTVSAVPRPGILRLMDAALDDPGVVVGVTSASTKSAVVHVLDVVLGKGRVERLDVFFGGDDIKEKKPNPLIYTTALAAAGLDPARTVVIEDSMIGLKAAKGAACRALITVTTSTVNEPFYATGADAVVPDLDHYGVQLEDVLGDIRAGGSEVCRGKKNGQDVVQLLEPSVGIDDLKDDGDDDGDDEEKLRKLLMGLAL